MRGIIGTDARTFRDWVTPQVHEIPWQIGKCEQSGRSENRCARKRGRRSKTITPAGLQRLKDEHRFLLSRERPAVVLGAALGQAICVLMHRVDMYAHLCIY